MQTFDLHNTSASGGLSVGSTTVLAGQTKSFSILSTDNLSLQQNANVGGPSGQTFTVHDTSSGGAVMVSVDGIGTTDVPAGQTKSFSIASGITGFVRQDVNIAGAGADPGAPEAPPPSEPPPRR